MDIGKAKQILESHGVIEVLHDGSPVWIENIIDGDKALVSYIDTKKRIELPLEELVEVQ